MQKQKRRAVPRQNPANQPAIAKRARRADTVNGAAVAPVRDAADRLYRASAECVRQRERYARLVDAGVHEEEQRAALRVACLCDELLFESARVYADVAYGGASGHDEAWWHTANALWHAGREYERRHLDCEEHAKQIGARRSGRLHQLALEFGLEASALLALRLAVQAYREVCPGCDLPRPTPPIVA